MRHLRVFLILLFVVLLPLRGALAAGMACPPAGTEPAHVHAPHEGTQAHGHGADHAHADVDGNAPHDHASAPDTCNFCTASCAVTALLPAMLDVGDAQEPATAFPHLRAPPPSFLSDGQERPPRST